MLTRAISIALLSVALVGAQIAGITHRVVHANPSGQGTVWQVPLPQNDRGDSSTAHDCAAYDAATLGNGPPLLQATWIAAPLSPLLPATVFIAVADSSPNLPFHPRAPPRA